MNDELRKKLAMQQSQVVDIKQNVFKQIDENLRKALDEKDEAKINYFEAFRHGVECMTEMIYDAIDEERRKKGREQ